MRWEAKTLAAAQFLISGAAPCLHLPRPPYHLHPCPAPASDNRRVPPTLSPHLRCSSCRDVGGREKQAAGTLKFLISISTKGRENLRSRTGVLQGAAGDTQPRRVRAVPRLVCLTTKPLPSFTEGRNHPKFRSKKLDLPGCEGARGSPALTWGRLPAPKWDPSCSAPRWLRPSGRGAARHRPPQLPWAAHGVRVPRAGTAGRCRASFQFNQSLQSFPPSPAAAGTHWRGPTPSRPTECFGHQVIDPGCREGSCHPCHARVSPGPGRRAPVLG